MNSRKIKIAFADISQASEIYEIEKLSFSVPWSIASIESFLNNTDTVCIVAKLDKVIGYIGMYDISGEGEITNVAVSPEHRTSGVGSMLVDALISEAKKRSISKLMLEVRSSNYPAQHLYKKYGFTEVGTRKNYYTYPKEDAILMDKIL